MRRAWARLLWLRFRLLQRHRHDRLVVEHAAGLDLVILPGVFNPALLRTGVFLARQLTASNVRAGMSVLDMGTGSGIGAIRAAKLGAKALAVDINPHALRCARINAIVNGVEGSVEVRDGDLFAPLEGLRFDLVLFNPPYMEGKPRTALEQAFRSGDTLERFVGSVREYLRPGGSVLMLLSNTSGKPEADDLAARSGLEVTVVAEQDLVNEVLTVYRLDAPVAR
jgi:release factor glutamine methyltransferase